MASKINLCIEHSPSRQLVHVEVADHESILTLDSDLPLYTVKNEDDLALMFDPVSLESRYRGTRSMPAWGRLDPADLRAVQVQVVETRTPVAIPRPRLIDKTVEKRKIPLRTAEGYADRKLSGAPEFMLFWLVKCPKNEDLDSLQNWEGKTVAARGELAWHNAFAIVAAPADYKDMGDVLILAAADPA